MFFAITRILFESDTVMATDQKDLFNLVEKIRARFKVCVHAVSMQDGGGSVGIAVASLASTEENLSQQIDAIAAFCEDSGFARVASEDTLMDHLDTVSEDLLE